MRQRRVVIDTNVLIAALLSGTGHNRAVLRECLQRRVDPLMGEALFHEYEDLMAREQLFRSCPLSGPERDSLFAAFLSTCDWVEVYYLWRPNLRDDADNHLIELAVAGSADMIVTNNVRDFLGAELRFPEIRIVDPAAFMKEIQ